MGAKIAKHYSSLKSPLSLFNGFSELFVSGPHNSTVLHFWSFEFLIVHELFSVFVNMEPYGSQTFKTLLLPLITFNFFQTLFSVVLTKSTVLDIWNFEFTIFNDFFFETLKFTIVPYG